MWKCLSTGQSEDELLLDELDELVEALEGEGLGAEVLGALVLGVLVPVLVELESELPELLRESLR